MTIVKLPYQVAYASSASPNLPWESDRFATWPQTLIIQLNGKQRIKKLQILSHHFMIAQRIDISIGNYITKTTINAKPVKTRSTAQKESKGAHWDQVYFNRVGYVSLNDNERTEFKARELKSIHLDVYGEFIHLSFDEPYMNPLNLFNQVGIVAVNILGEQEIFDPLMHWTRAIYRAKDKAIEEENYSYAKELKLLAEQASSRFDEITSIDNLKKEAIEKEEFDQAKSLKEKGDAMREEFAKWVSSQGFKLVDGVLVRETSKHIKEQDMPGDRDIRHDQTDELLIEKHEDFRSEGGIGGLKEEDRRIKADAVLGSSIANLHEDRPIKPMKGPFELGTLDESSLPPGEEANDAPKKVPIKKKPPVKKVADNSEASAVKKQNVAPVKQDNPSGLFSNPGDPPFDGVVVDSTVANNTDFAEAIQLYSAELVACLLSKAYPKKDWAIQIITERLKHAIESSSTDFDEEVITKAHLSLTLVILSDSREKLVLAGINIWSMLLELLQKKAYQGSTNSDTKRIESLLLNNLIQKFGDLKQRDLIADFCLKLCTQYPTVSQQFFKSEKSKEVIPPKLIKARLELCARLTLELPIEVSLPPTPIMKWAIGYWSHSQGEVRDAVSELLIATFKRLLKRAVAPQEAKKVILAAISQEKPLLVQHVVAEIDKIIGPATALSEVKPISSASLKGREPSEVRPGTSASVKARDSVHIKRTETLRKKSLKPEVLSNQWNIDNTCIFCEEQNKDFNANTLDQHYWKDCMMLIRCDQCGNIIEIASIAEHLVNECDAKNKHKQCDRCKLSFLADDAHFSQQDCVETTSDSVTCPLCREILRKEADKTFEALWKQHIISTGCPNNARDKRKPSPKKVGNVTTKSVEKSVKLPRVSASTKDDKTAEKQPEKKKGFGGLFRKIIK